VDKNLSGVALLNKTNQHPAVISAKSSGDNGYCGYMDERSSHHNKRRNNRVVFRIK
jgi:hypothetical protein